VSLYKRVTGRAAQREILKTWQLDLSPGQYRRHRNGDLPKRPVKLVHNIVLSMPLPTAPGRVLIAAREFAREKFALTNRYALVLHADQAHPHVHLVVKAHSNQGRRLHVDKAMLRGWREDFARMMRDQGVPANATPRFCRDRSEKKRRDSANRGRQSSVSGLLRDQSDFMGETQLSDDQTAADPRLKKIAVGRKRVRDQWSAVADILESQGEISLAADVRYFGAPPRPAHQSRELARDDLLREGR
jgi:hypothetical protein